MKYVEKSLSVVDKVTATRNLAQKFVLSIENVELDAQKMSLSKHRNIKDASHQKFETLIQMSVKNS